MKCNSNQIENQILTGFFPFRSDFVPPSRTCARGFKRAGILRRAVSFSVRVSIMRYARPQGVSHSPLTARETGNT